MKPITKTFRSCALLGMIAIIGVLSVNYAAAATISGVVTEKGNSINFLIWTTLVLQKQSNGTFTKVDSTEVDADAVYKFSAVDVGTYRIIAAMDKFYPDTVPVTITSASQVKTQDIQLTIIPVGKIQGFVSGDSTNPEGVTGIWGVTVTLKLKDSTVTYTETASNGLYEFEDLIIGATYNLTFEKPKYVTTKITHKQISAVPNVDQVNLSLPYAGAVRFFGVKTVAGRLSVRLSNNGVFHLTNVREPGTIALHRLDGKLIWSARFSAGDRSVTAPRTLVVRGKGLVLNITGKNGSYSTPIVTP